MGLPPPRLRDLAAWIQGENSRTETGSREVWEISVPAKMSLPWSLVLSVLFSESGESFPDLLRKLTGDESETKEIKEKKKLNKSKINPDMIKKRLNSFNPFKNRHTFFPSKEVSEIVRIFDLRLKRHANKIRSRTVEWNDDLKLKAASNLLACEIKVFLRDEIESLKFKSYLEAPADVRKIIVLFQCENQLHGKRKDPINIFHFAMTIRRAHALKIDALRHFLKVAKICPASITNVIQLMTNPDSHGRGFLPTILRSRYLDILPEIYRSPYIAFKLSEAGFETDPIAGLAEKPSALCYALCNTDQKYIRILYDYASNCRCLFDRSVRRANNTVIETLERIKTALESDLSEISKYNFEKSIEERALYRLKQLNRFAEYQIKIVSDLRHLKNKYRNRSESAEFEFRREIIISILEHYLTFFYYDSSKSENMSQDFTGYLNFTDYYEFTDSFSFLSFFDNFYKLKHCFGINEENRVLNVEWKILLTMMSNKYFPKSIHEIECEDEHKSNNCGKNKNILRRIPLFHRTTLESAVKTFRDKLKSASNYDDSKRCLTSEKLQANDSVSSSQVIDELLIFRLKKYIEAALAVSPSADGMRAVLVIERAMQVLGESLKPPSSMNSIVSFLLRSCLPSNLQVALIRIRNDLSKYRSNSIYGKLTVEEDSKIFEEIKEELRKIQEAFETVNFTQTCRIEDEVMYLSRAELKDSLESDAYNEFQREYEFRISKRKQEYIKYHRKCILLLVDTISDLQDYSRKKPETQNIFGQLKSIEYLLRFILRIKSEEYLVNLLDDVHNCIKLNMDKYLKLITEMKRKDQQLEEMLDETKPLKGKEKQVQKFKKVMDEQLNDLRQDIKPFLEKCKKEILKRNPKKDVFLSAPKIEIFYECLKQNMFSSEEIVEINEAVENALHEAIGAKTELEDIFNEQNYESTRNVDELLKRILISSEKLSTLKSCFVDRNSTDAAKYLKKCISEDSIKNDVKKMLDEGSVISGYGYTLLTKIAFQRNYDSEFYTSAILSEIVCKKLEYFLTKKANFLITRLKALKNILIDEDEEIQTTWQWGRSEAFKYHMKYLMRQRYIREITVRASLEMAFFDCVNIFHESLKEDDRTDASNSLRKFYEKSTNLFEGIDLRNLVSHRTNIPETIGDILDEDDFPTEMVEKMLELIDDTEAIEAMLDLFRMCGALEEKDFTNGIANEKFGEHSNLMKVVTECTRWKNYLFLFPFIKT